jgi:DNA-binding response OmpR family regulator
VITKVLLVEDDPSAVFGYARYLSKAGYDVTEARTLAEAERARRYPASSRR